MTQRIQHHEQSDPPNKANPLKSKKKRGHLEPACEEDPRRLRKSGAFDRRGQLDAPPLTRKGNPWKKGDRKTQRQKVDLIELDKIGLSGKGGEFVWIEATFF